MKKFMIRIGMPLLMLLVFIVMPMAHFADVLLGQSRGRISLSKAYKDVWRGGLYAIRNGKRYEGE